MLREVVDQNCIGGISCASARGAGVNFQACSFNHSDISPLSGINSLAELFGGVQPDCEVTVK
jgi:hypothetical protein